MRWRRRPPIIKPPTAIQQQKTKIDGHNGIFDCCYTQFFVTTSIFHVALSTRKKSRKKIGGTFLFSREKATIPLCAQCTFLHTQRVLLSHCCYVPAAAASAQVCVVHTHMYICDYTTRWWWVQKQQLHRNRQFYNFQCRRLKVGKKSLIYHDRQLKWFTSQN